MGLRIRIHLHGGPHNGKTASTKLLLDNLILCDGYDLKAHCYVRIDELEYGYSRAQSLEFPRSKPMA
jgi:hypothetical protein